MSDDVVRQGKLWYNKIMRRTNNTGFKTKYRLQLSIPVQLALTFGLMLLFSILLNFLLNWEKEGYQGLGEPEAIPAAVYSAEGFYYGEDGRLYYEDDVWTSRQVVDVSSFQHEVDWQQVAGDGIDMAMIRLGYRGYESGLLNLDPYFEQNVKGAREAGLETGVYFFSQALTVEEAEEEARFVLKHIRRKGIDGPVAFDMEHIEGVERISALTVEEKTAIADAFCQTIEKRGYETLIYGNPKWFTEDVDLSLLTHRDIWLAHYVQLTGWPSWYRMWQYTDRGSVAGIEGGVDLSVQLVLKSYKAV